MLRPEASDRDEPSRRLEYEELKQALDGAMGGIPAEYRDVILLRVAARMDYAAIAEVLRIPVGTVRSRLSRTRRMFRVALSRVEEIPDDTGTR